MNAPARAETAFATVCRQPMASAAYGPLIVLTLRAWARARLWQASDLDLHEAVDILQAAAVRDGLVAKLGQDEVQHIMVEVFAPVREDRLKVEHISDDPWSAPSWHEAAVEYHKDRGKRPLIVEIEPERLGRLLADDVSLERAWAEVSKPTGLAASTIRAADHLVRAGNIERLQLWLAKRSAAERTAIQKHLGGKRVAKPATDR